jgi:hypothetical protein
MVPIGDVAAKGATPAEKLAALRTASNKGWLELVRVEDGTGRLVPSEPTAGGSFDKSDQEEFDKK